MYRKDFKNTLLPEINEQAIMSILKAQNLILALSNYTFCQWKIRFTATLEAQILILLLSKRKKLRF